MYYVDLHLELEVNVASTKKSEMNALVTRHKVLDGLDENVKNHSCEELKSAILQFLQGNKRKSGNKQTLL